MIIQLIALLLIPFIALGGDPGAYTEKPDIVGSITAALKDSKVERLTPRTYEHRKKHYSYHLCSVTYLGTIERAEERFILATAFFRRSSARGGHTPPARGHGFLLCLTPDFQLLSNCRLASPQMVSLEGTSLRRGKNQIGDFSLKDAQSRNHGFLIDGDDILPYPFSDRITEKAEEQPIEFDAKITKIESKRHFDTKTIVTGIDPRFVVHLILKEDAKGIGKSGELVKIAIHSPARDLLITNIKEATGTDIRLALSHSKNSNVKLLRWTEPKNSPEK